jgi:hypothetical protein
MVGDPRHGAGTGYVKLARQEQSLVRVLLEDGFRRAGRDVRRLVHR